MASGAVQTPPKERPYLVLSDDDTHPFHGSEYAVVGLTTTDRQAALRLDEPAWAMGHPGSESYASPWYVFTIKHGDIIRPKGTLTSAATDEIARAVAMMVGARP